MKKVIKKASKKAAAKVKCGTCGGGGFDPAAPRFKCQDCNGTGEKQHFKYMFWPYSEFPYVCGAPGFMEDNGAAYIPSYGDYFRPCKVLDLIEGKTLWDALWKLKQERNMAIKTLERGFATRLIEQAPFLKVSVRLS